MGLYAIGGLLQARRRPSCAFTNPTTNSYKRLVPGYEAPVNLAYSRAIARPLPYPDVHPQSQGQAGRVPLPRSELQSLPRLLRYADGHARRHQNKMKPGEPLDKDIYDLSPEELAKVPETPGARRGLEALKADHEFLLRGDVFTADVIDTWIWYKTEKEVDAMRLRPHPYEFCLYFDQ